LVDGTPDERRALAAEGQISVAAKVGL